ncbi:hypothetical protein AWB74_02354 [Caballeronia arvi]|uniref:Uncharacterized protein n=1 Tax=Caballeronia arvi TaxID=1777135 RepID=A0A158I3J2_9BURK|nr:hypothetical protein AWB74_02354 [Caballeronia arvi]
MRITERPSCRTVGPARVICSGCKVTACVVRYRHWTVFGAAPSPPSFGAAIGAERTATPAGTSTVLCIFSASGVSWTTESDGIMRR